MPLRLRVLPSDDTLADGKGGPRGPLVARDVELSDTATELRIGRRADVELPLPFAALSGVHARLAREASGWTVEDLGSTNGTWLDGARVPPGQRRALAPGAELRLANVRLRFEGAGPARPEAQGTATLARRLVDDLFAKRGHPTLRTPPAHVFPLATVGQSFVVGRAETCGLSLPLEELSREHAAFVRREDGVVVRDLGSKNGVVVAGVRVVGERLLSDGDVVHLGPVPFTFEDPAARYLRELEQLGPEPEPVPVVDPPAPAAAPVPAPTPTVAASEERAKTGATTLVLGVAVSVLLLLALAVGVLVFGRG